MNIKKTISTWFNNLKYFFNYSPLYVFLMIIVSIVTGILPIIITYFSKEALTLIDYKNDFSRVIILVLLVVIFKVTLEATFLINNLASIQLANKINLKIKKETLYKIRTIKYENFYDDNFLNDLYLSSSFNSSNIQ